MSLAAATTFAIAIIAMLRFVSPVPIADIWWMFKDYRENGMPPLATAWDALFATPHRIPLPKLFYWTDWWIAGGTGYFSAVASAAAQAANASLAWWWLRRQAGGDEGQLRLANLAGAILFFALFTMQQWENLLHGFQVCFTLWLCLALAANIATLERRPMLGHAAVIGSMLCVVGGVCAWPVMLALNWLQKAGRRQIAFGIAVPAVFCAIYQYQLVVVHRVAPDSMAPFFLRFFARPFFEGDSPALIWAGPLLLLAGILASLRLLALPTDPHRKVNLLIAANIAFLILVTGVISWGRGDWGFAVRYNTVALLFWAWTSIGLLRWNARLFLVPVLLCIGMAGRQMPDAWHTAANEYRDILVEGTARAARVQGPWEVPPGGVGDWLARQRKSLWGVEPFSLLGTRWNGSRECGTERIQYITPVQNGWRVESAGNEDSEFGVLVRDPDLTVVGVAVRVGQVQGTSRWTGHVPADLSGSRLRFATTGSGGCLAARVTPVPAR